MVRSFLNNALSIVNTGTVLIKFSFGQTSRAKRFARLIADVDYRNKTRYSLGWGSVSTQKLNKYVSMKDVSVVLYGHQSNTFLKHENLSEAPWLCFSVMACGRSFDFCALDAKHGIFTSFSAFLPTVYE